MASLQRSFERRRMFKQYGSVKKYHYHKTEQEKKVAPNIKKESLFSRIKKRITNQKKSNFNKDFNKKKV